MNLHCFAGDPLGGFAHVGLHHAGFHRTFAFAHHFGNCITELAGRLDDHRHAPEFYLGEFIVDDVLAEHIAIVGIVVGRFVGRLHQTNSAGCGLQPTIFKTFHLKIETLA